jgi:sugar phosphate isomerase/epimerase
MKNQARIALQMYTLREQMARDAMSALRDVAAAGYDTVELVGYGDATFNAIALELDQLDLHALGAHVPYEDLDARFGPVTEELLRLGARYVVVQQARPSDWAGEDAVRRLAEQFNRWGEDCRALGLSLGYHGYHEIEVEFAPAGERTLYDLMVDETEPGLLHIQVDTYWVHRLGRDPAATVREYAGRIPTLHAKDVAPSDDGMDTPVGDGVIAWPEVLAAAEDAGTQWIIVEQEGDPGHAVRDIGRSLQNLQGLLNAVHDR